MKQLVRIASLGAAFTLVQVLLAPALAAAQRKGKAGSSIERAGENAADLLSGIVGPVLIVMIGVIAVSALVRREVGMAVSAAIVGLIGGLFVFAPDQAEAAFLGIYKAIF